MTPRPSLLVPGTARTARLSRLDWSLLAAAALLAFAIRWSIRGAQPYTAEAAHYAMSLHLWHGTTNVGSLFADVKPDTFSWFFWQRPLLCLLYWPAAALGGFPLYRASHILVAALVPALAATLLRHLGTRPAYAHGAAFVLAVHPILVPWGTLVLPDTTVCAFALAGLLAAHDGRPRLTAALLLAGAWVKETEFVTTVALLGLALLRDADGSALLSRRPRVGPFARWLAPALVLSFVPLWVSVHALRGAMPGFRPGGDMLDTSQRLFLLLWLAPVPLLGLLSPRVRRLALVALAWPAFFFVYHAVLGKAIEVWYNVVPATLVLVASAASLSALPRDGPPARRWAPAAVSLALVGLLMVQVAVPQHDALNRAAATPLDHKGQWDLRETLASERGRDADLAAALAFVPAGERGNWTALDMDYSLVMYPLAQSARHVNKDFTPDWNMTDDAFRWWQDALENRSDATFLVAPPTLLGRAMQEAYAPCAPTFGLYTVIVASKCRGEGSDLRDAWHRLHDGA
jgi:hypothetical protein